MLKMPVDEVMLINATSSTNEYLKIIERDPQHKICYSILITSTVDCLGQLYIS